MEKDNGWFGLAGKLVWPVFIVVLMLLFSNESGEVYRILRDRIKAGSALKVGLLEIGEQANKTEIGALVFPDLPVEAIGGPAEAVLKQSGRAPTTASRGVEEITVSIR